MTHFRKLRHALPSSLATAATVLVLTLILGATATAVTGARVLTAAPEAVDAWEIEVDATEFETLRMEGFDILTIDAQRKGRLRIGLALAAEDVARLHQLGLEPTLWRDSAGRTYAQTWDAIQQEGGFTVYRSWDEAGGIRDEIQQIAAEHPDLVKLVKYGETLQGRDLLALKVTKDANTTEDGAKPASLYNALQHSREWIAVEVNRRMVHHFVDGFGTDPEITQLLTDNEYWFVVVANPDGYQFTYTEGRRLWRKNMRDNNGDGQVANGDGVDLNRNFDANWNYDSEGSSGNAGSETYRGPSPASEPETLELQNLMNRVGFKFVINYHSAAELLLWPEGWQDQTRTPDDPIYTALAGSIPSPAIQGFEPMLSAGLYITNGETCDFAHTKADALCYTPELSRPPGGGGTFEFPDDEALIQAEFMKNLPFALDVARSTTDPTQPSSHLGNTVQSFYVDAFSASHGDPQPVQANVQRKLGDVTMVYRIGGGAEVRVPATEWAGGERYGGTGDVYYHRVRAEVTGAPVGETVSVWFEAGGESSAPFDYVAGDSGGKPVLVVYNEDYTGIDPAYPGPTGPRWAEPLEVALTALGVAYDTYDVDAAGAAPSQLGVLQHYPVVIWHTGDDIAPRKEGMDNGDVSRLAHEMMLAIRGYLNEGGKLLYTGKYAGAPYFQGLAYDPEGDLPCALLGEDGGPRYCESLSNDFLQYYLGAWGYANVRDTTGGQVVGQMPPLNGMTLPLRTAGSPHAGLFRLTKDVMSAPAYARFASDGAAILEGTGISPHTGDQYLYSREVPYAWQRVSRTVDLASATSAALTFWTYRDTRQPFDALIVEARATDGDAWTTLPDENGHTSQTAALSCSSSQWYNLFPHIAHYMTPDPDAQDGCRPEGTTGEWHAATANSNGWEEWLVDLSAWAGSEVEVSITYVRSRVAVFGVLLDDVAIEVDGAVTAETSFEGDLGGWTLGGLETNGQAHTEDKDFILATKADLPQPVGNAVVATGDTVLLGFGFESIDGEATRQEALRRILLHLGLVIPGQATPTMPPPTPTPEPTETPLPTNTPDVTPTIPAPPTDTPEPGTETPDPGTETPDPGTATPATETPDPGTETPETPTPTDEPTVTPTDETPSVTPPTATGTPEVTATLLPPTGLPPTTVPPTTVPGLPEPLVCPNLSSRVPAAAIAAAVANPAGVFGWGQRCYPSQPASPFNSYRRYLSLQNPGKPYDARFNSVVFTCGCR